MKRRRHIAVTERYAFIITICFRKCYPFGTLASISAQILWKTQTSDNVFDDINASNQCLQTIHAGAFSFH